MDASRLVSSDVFADPESVVSLPAVRCRSKY